MAIKIRVTGVIGDSEQSARNVDRSGKPVLKNGAYHANTAGDIAAILDAHPDEKDLFVEIDSAGGGVYDGFGMYDALRTSGRNIHTNIANGCHSIAVVLLLAAPKNQRSANPNARSLIHLVRVETFGALTGAELEQSAETIRRDEERMISIYVERTGINATQARDLIRQEKMHAAEDLLKMGFISKINQYKSNQLTNLKTYTMAERKEGATLLERIGGFLVNAAKVLQPSNYNYEDAEGGVLFSTASESDDLAVGMEVSFPDDSTGGVFELPASENMPARIVTTENFVVTALEEVQPNGLTNLETENAALRDQLAEAVNLIEELKGQISSNYVPQNRTVTKPTTATRTAQKANEKQKTADMVKNEVKENFKAGFGKRSIIAPKN